MLFFFYCFIVVFYVVVFVVVVFLVVVARSHEGGRQSDLLSGGSTRKSGLAKASASYFYYGQTDGRTQRRTDGHQAASKSRNASTAGMHQRGHAQAHIEGRSCPTYSTRSIWSRLEGVETFLSPL